MLGCMKRTRMQNEMHMMSWYDMHDMNKMKNKRQNPTTEGILYHIAENGKSWSYKMESYIRGVTTLHHYKRISSRDLGLKELWIFRTEVVLALPGGFSVGMV